MSEDDWGFPTCDICGAWNSRYPLIDSPYGQAHRQCVEARNRDEALRQEGALREREAVLRWLRRMGPLQPTPADRILLDSVVVLVECGDHLREGT